MRRNLATASISLILLVIGACGKGTPVAPNGTKLTVTASPTEIASNGSAVVTVTALRSTGGPVNPGTEIRLATSLGTIDPVVTTDDRGMARALLQGNGRSGTAKVTANSGSATEATVDVTIGVKVDKVTLTVSPTSVDVTQDATVTLRAVVRDDDGLAVPGVGVIFSSEVGQLDSRGGLVMTDSTGTATDRLRVTSTELNLVADSSVKVGAEVSGGGGSASVSSEILIRKPPIASFSYSINHTTRQVTFTDTSTGGPTDWHWDFGDGSSSNARNPVHTYAEPGTYDVTLTASNVFGSDEFSDSITIEPPTRLSGSGRR